MIGLSSAEANDYQFTSCEVKQLAFRLDGLFLPTDKDENKPFYLVEVQFQPDDDLYYRLFAELFLFLRQYQPPHTWHVVVIYASRNVEKQQPKHFGKMLNLEQVQRIYLDELGEAAGNSLGVGVVKLVVESEEDAVEAAKSLINKAREELVDEAIQRNLIDLIETIMVYKLPQKSREEIEAMFGLSDLKQTKVYQEALEEGEKRGERRGEQKGEQKAKLESIPRMLKLGLSLEIIASSLDLPLEVVQQAAGSSHDQ